MWAVSGKMLMILGCGGLLHSLALRSRVQFCLVLCGAVILLLAACGPVAPRPVADFDAMPVWPAPPDPPRFQYETTLRSYADVLPSKLKLEIRKSLPGGDRYFETMFDKVGAIAARHGRIYLTDAVQRSIVVFDVPRRKAFRFGQRHPGNLIKPVGIALDDGANVYVADVARRQVLVFDSLGLLLRTVGGPADLERPVGVAVDAAGQRIYVTDRGGNDNDRHRVVMFDADGSKLGVLGARGGAEGQFNIPVQAVVGRDGTLYVLDSGNFRVQVFSAEGKFLRAFGSVGSGAANFARPRGIAVDDEGNVYVSDAYFGNVQVFDAQGRLLVALGRIGERDIPGRYGLVSGIAVDETGRVYVGDQLFRKVEVIRRLSAAETGLPR